MQKAIGEAAGMTTSGDNRSYSIGEATGVYAEVTIL
jgi:hypothetical protein